MHHFNEDSLKECFNLLDGTKAVGTDMMDLLVMSAKELTRLEVMQRLAFRQLDQTKAAQLLKLSKSCTGSDPSILQILKSCKNFLIN